MVFTRKQLPYLPLELMNQAWFNAAKQSDILQLDQLSKSNINPNIQDRISKNTALHILVNQRKSSQVYSFLQTFESQIDFRVRNFKGWTVIHSSVADGTSSTIALLCNLLKSSPPRPGLCGGFLVRNNLNWTPFHLFIHQSDNSNPNVAYELAYYTFLAQKQLYMSLGKPFPSKLSFWALNFIDKQGDTPLHTAVRMKKSFLLQGLIDCEQDNPELLGNRIKFDTKDSTGLDPLRIAINQGSIRCVHFLLDDQPHLKNLTTFDLWGPINTPFIYEHRRSQGYYYNKKFAAEMEKHKFDGVSIEYDDLFMLGRFGNLARIL